MSTQPPNSGSQASPTPQPYQDDPYLPSPSEMGGYRRLLNPPPKSPVRKKWYSSGPALLVIGLLGLVSFVLIAVDVDERGPSPEHTFISGGSTIVHFNAGAGKVIYGSHAAKWHNVHCDVKALTGSERRPTVKKYASSLVSKEWEAVFTVTVGQAGDYAVTCTGADSDKFGVVDSATLAPFLVGRP